MSQNIPKKENFPFYPLEILVQSNSKIMGNYFELFQNNPENNFNSFGIPKISSVDDYYMSFIMEELNDKIDNEIDIDRLYFITNPENKEEGKKVNELLKEILNDDIEIKDNIKNRNIITLTEIDKVIITEKNTKNQGELLKSKEIEAKNDTTKLTNEQTKLFKEVKQISNNESIQFLYKKIKRGEKDKTKNPKKNSKTNDVFSEYNLSRKIRSHFLNFCVLFSNDLIKNFRTELNYFYKKLIKLNKDFKTSINKKTDKSLKKKNLGEIINTKISSKNINSNINHNQNIYKEDIQKNEALMEIFSIKYKELFNIYFNNKKIINLKDYGLNQDILKKYKLNKDIRLSLDVKMFNDLLENNTTCKDFLNENNYSMAKKYKNSLKNCAIIKYKSNSIFTLKED